VRVIQIRRSLCLVLLAGFFPPFLVRAQIDPVERKLVQVGYNAAFEGHAPQAGYAFYYYNQPDFLKTNLTFRLALAPTYLDSEVGFVGLLGEHTDLGIGFAGGGFADNYWEIRQGQYLQSESFDGYGGEGSVSVYHLFNPEQLIPLNGILRGIVHYSTYADTDRTAKNFESPDNRYNFMVRTGFRFGGKEPILFPSLAMELSVWYEGEFRTDAEPYGFRGDRKVNAQSHLFWGQALLAYTFTNINHNMYISLIGGSSIDADRFSAYRLGALLPMASEFPLSLPGYYYQEISARSFVLLGGNYLMPIDRRQRWNIDLTAATAVVDYLPGFDQPGHSHSGMGGGIMYKTPSFKIMVGYAHGFNAIRSSGRGANSIGVLMQLDWAQAHGEIFNPTQPNLWQGMQRIFGLFGQ
jgi:hypothetical protein